MQLIGDEERQRRESKQINNAKHSKVKYSEAQNRIRKEQSILLKEVLKKNR